MLKPLAEYTQDDFRHMERITEYSIGHLGFEIHVRAVLLDHDPFQSAGVPCWQPSFSQYASMSIWAQGGAA